MRAGSLTNPVGHHLFWQQLGGAPAAAGSWDPLRLLLLLRVFVSPADSGWILSSQGISNGISSQLNQNRLHARCRAGQQQQPKSRVDPLGFGTTNSR